MPVQTRYWLIAGHVQGVGFRPFVYRLALRHQLHGHVKNLGGEVEILAQGPAEALDAFADALIQQAPAIAKPRIIHEALISTPVAARFDIHASAPLACQNIHVPPDYFTCPECLAELRDPLARRHGYPFINCTQCGPRYTLIRRLPYDRPHTTLADFPLCADCRVEYENPLDRRFHAQPLACPLCGPRLEWVLKKPSQRAQMMRTTPSDALVATVQVLRNGGIVAVKGIGGYHLLCDAANSHAVQTLRRRKPRPAKPLAVMFPEHGADGLASVQANVHLTPAEARLLVSPMRPIVLARLRAEKPWENLSPPPLKKGEGGFSKPDRRLLENPLPPFFKGGSKLVPELAPGLSELGVMLPYSPLHHLLLEAFGGPLVATSGNLSGEPVLIDNTEAQDRLAHVADAFLHHNRPIARPADDPVFRTLVAQPRPLRLGRGAAPLELELPSALAKPLLAVGGHLKNSVALAWERRVVISPHIGELDSPRGVAVFSQVIADLQALYQVQAAAVACDAHAGYASSRWAARCGLPLSPVWHHHAHASALAGEYPQISAWLVFTWDGTGLGADNTLWGGETLLGRPGHWQRVARLRPFYLPGGDKAGREPWRSAAAVCWEAGLDRQTPAGTDHTLLRQAWQRRLNCPQSSAAGRLFDAAAALLGLGDYVSYEGEGPMRLEALAGLSDPTARRLEASGRFSPLPITQNALGLWETDWFPLLTMLRDTGLPAAYRALIFHHRLAASIAEVAHRLRAETGVTAVGLSGGVFQNRLLSELSAARLEAAGFQVYLPAQVPINDAGLSFGQVHEVLRNPEEPTDRGASVPLRLKYRSCA